MRKLLFCFFVLFVHLFAGAQAPNTLSGLALWLDASDINGNGSSPGNGSAIVSWMDKSGNGRSASAVGAVNAVYNANAINGKGVLTFTRSSITSGSGFVSGLDIRAATNPDLTVITVYRPTSSTGDQALWGNDNGNWDRVFFPRFGGTANGAVSTGPVAPNTTVVPGAGTLSQVRLLTAIYDGNVSGGVNTGVTNASAVYLNGQLVSNFTDRTDASAAQTAFRIGFDGDDNYFSGDIAEVIVYNRVLSSCDIQSVNRYLSTKYGQGYAAPTITAPATTLCFGETINLSFTPEAGYTYQWHKDGVAIGGATSSTYAATATGVYTVAASGPCGGTDMSSGFTISSKAICITCPANINTCTGVVNYAPPTLVLNPTNTLTTTLAQGNNNRGAMFDVQAINTLTVTSFDAIVMGNANISIYYKPGSYVGSMTNAAAWTLAGTVPVSGQLTLANIPLPVNVTIPAGQTYAFYITVNDNSNIIVYTSGTGSGTLVSSDANLRFFEGIGASFPLFTSTVSNRRWNGRINYLIGAGPTITRTAGPASGSVFPAGTTVVTHQATLGATTASCSFNVKTSNPSGSTVVTNVACYGGTTGAINLTPTGGTGPYTFNWGGGITTEDRTNLAAGNYTVTITDANGCQTTISNITVSEPSMPLSGSTVVTNVTCSGGNNGTINLTPSGGTSGYTFLWNNGSTTEDRTGLAAGTYSVTITDANGCQSTISNITVSDGTPVTMNAVANQTVCASDATTAVTFSGTGSSYSWTNNNTSIGLSASGSGNIATFTAINNGTTPQIATITVTPSTGSCVGTAQTFTITVNPRPAATITGGTFCRTGTTTLSVSGQGGGTFNAPAGLAITAATGQIDLAASTPGTYTVTYNFSNGTCSNSTTSSITVNGLPTASISSGTFCNTGTTTLTVTGQGGGTFSSTAGLVLNAATGEINLGTSVPGTYTVTYTFTNGTCSNATTSTITVNALPVAAISGGTFCKVGTEQLTVTSGQMGGSFSAPAGLDINTSGLINLANSTPGTYTVTYAFTDGSCTNTITANVTVNPLPAASISGSTTICENATAPVITFTGSSSTAPYTFIYKINGGADQTVTTTSGNVVTIAVPTGTPGTFTYSLVSVKGTTGCEATASGSAVVTVTAMPTATLSYAATPYCSSGKANPTFSGTTGGTYTSTTGLSINTTTGEVDLSASTPGTYTVTYTIPAAAGCTQVQTTANLTVNAIPAMPFITTTSATTFCAGGNVLLTSSAVTGNQWFKDGAIITGATAATYTATISGNYAVQSTQTGCVSPMSIAKAVIVTPLPAKPVITESGNVLTSSAAADNQWLLGGTAITGATATTYRVQANGAYTVQVTQNGCTNTSDVLNFTATRIDNPSAWNGEVSIYPNPVVKNLFIKNTTGRRLQVQLFDALGQKVYEGKINGTQGVIHVEGFAGGPYQLLITDLTKNQRISQTIIKLQP